MKLDHWFINPSIKSIALASGLLVTLTASATEVDELFSLSLQELSQVEITGATLTSENIDTVPAAVSVYTYETINRMGFDSLHELMAVVPGFQSYRSNVGSFYYPYSARGRRINTSSAEVLVMVDGQRLEEPGTSGAAQIIPQLSLLNVERVEFIRGPGAALYGSNAMLGVINIITRTAANEASLALGTHHRNRGHLLASTILNDFEFDVFALWDEDEGETYDRIYSFDVHQASLRDPLKVYQFQFKLKGYGISANFQAYRAESQGFYSGSAAAPLNEHFSERNAFSLRYDFDWLSIKSYLWFEKAQSRFQPEVQLSGKGDLLAFSEPASSAPWRLKFNLDPYEEDRLQFHNDWLLSEDSNVLFGFEYRHIDSPTIYTASNYDYISVVVPEPFPYLDEFENVAVFQEQSKRDIFGIYTQYQTPLVLGVNAFIGLRYDYFSSLDEELTPKLGFIKQLDAVNTLKFLYGHSFRAPSENELNFVPNGSLSGNKRLQPEVVKTREIVWLTTWLEQLDVSLGYFENHYENSIVLVSTGNGQEVQYQNAPQSPSKGLELELALALNRHWMLRSSFFQLTSRPSEGYREARTTASFTINYSNHQVNLNLVAFYQGEREMEQLSSTDRLTLDSYTLLTGKLSYDYSASLNFFIQADNLADVNFETPAFNSAYDEGLPGRRREILGGFVYSF